LSTGQALSRDSSTCLRYRASRYPAGDPRPAPMSRPTINLEVASAFLCVVMTPLPLILQGFRVASRELVCGVPETV
jgi:hypothetical protein